MIQFILLFLWYLIFIYGLERWIRRIGYTFSKGFNPFQENLLKKIEDTRVMRFFAAKNYWSNTFFITAIISAALSIIGALYYFPRPIVGVVAGIVLFLDGCLIAWAASFSGNTWIRKLRDWTLSLDSNPAVKILKQLAFELIFVLAPVLQFLIATFVMLTYYAQQTETNISVYLVFYALPLFFPLWIYRVGNDSAFQMNVRRLFVYMLVALVVLFNQNPVEILTKGITVSKPDIRNLLPEFWVVAFIAFDRVGKVIIELLAQCKDERAGSGL